jgi:hypothetical protein
MTTAMITVQECEDSSANLEEFSHGCHISSLGCLSCSECFGFVDHGGD